jgi:hypothetical protein
MEMESNQTLLYEGEDRDGDQVQIVGLKNGDALLRVRNAEERTAIGVYLDYEMITDMISTLMTMKVALSLFPRMKGDDQ